MQVNIEIMRTFVRLRRALANHEDLARKLDELESRYDKQFRTVFEAIRQLMSPPARVREPIGYDSWPYPPAHDGWHNQMQEVKILTCCAAPKPSRTAGR